VILIIMYILYLTFEFVTHKTLFQEESQKVAMKPRKDRLPEGAVLKGLAAAGGVVAAQGRSSHIAYETNANDDIMRRDAWDQYAAQLREEQEEPQMYFWVCIATLVIGTTILAFNTQFMTDSIDSLTTTAGVPRDFIGIILLPILSNDLAAIQMAIRDKMDVALQAALGKSLQTTLLVTPFLVLLAWIMGNEDMNLLFDGFQVVALFASVLLIQNGILHGKSNW
jgi:Ca2+:H+ antiporter